jgi:hypothetical protein
MINLKIDELKPGMILAGPVRNHQGVLLLEAGSRITKKSIRIFKSWGVAEIAIKGELSEATGDVRVTDVRVEESVENQLKDKFSEVMDDPVMVEIFNVASRLLIKDYQNNESENGHP